MSEKLNNKVWRQSGEYLPEFMRDFHDCKDLFKTIEETYGRAKGFEVDWVKAQVYVVDHFLWFMATHGYTLQRTRKMVEYRDIHKTISDAKEKRDNASAELLNSVLANPSK